jgi:hypothetical protein
MAAVVPVFVASPAGAANGCTAGEFPSTFAAQASLKVACHTDAGTNTNHIEIHDANNAVYHHGGARNVNLAKPSSGNAVTSGSATIFFASGTLKNTDVRRPINSFNAAKASVFAGGTFIVSVAPAACTTACTSAVLSQKAKVTGGTVAVPLLATIEHTNNRYLDDVTCGAGGNTLTSVTAKWVAGDVNKSVSGGPLSDGTFITSVAGNVATLNQTHTNACTTTPLHTGDQITVGGATYVAGVPQVFNNDPMTIQLSNSTSGGQGLTCSGSTLGMTLGSKTDTGGFNANYIGMAAAVKGSGATVVAAKITAVNTTGNTSATIAPACPAGVSATVGFAGIGVRGANGPGNAAVMMSLAAELNLSDALVATQDDCNLNTFEGFQVMGGWTNPGAAYAANAFAAKASVSQVIFPTSVLSFNGYVVPKRGGDSVDATPHYNFSFPLLPTSLAVCLNLGVPANDVQLAFGINSTVVSAAPFLATGSGNNGDPPVRQLLPKTGTFTTTMELILNPSTVVSTTSDTCTISVSTATPGVPCGDG